MKKAIRITIITLILFILMGCYKPLIGLFVDDKYMAAFLQKLFKVITVVIFVSKLKLWEDIGSLKRISKQAVFMLLPVALIALIPLLNGFKIESISGVFIVLLTAIFIGIIEEVLFRGVIFSSLEEIGKGKAIIISSVAFALVHFLNMIYGANFTDTLVQVVFAFGFGLVMAAMRSRTNLLLPAIIVHALWDFVSDISNTNFAGSIDTIHSLGLVTVFIWGICLAVFVCRQKESSNTYHL